MGTNPKRLGKYELLMRLGQGGMAEVWKGFDPQLQRMVAIKFLHANLRSDPDFMSRFVREGQAIAALRHPNIVQVYDFQVSSPEDENPMAYMVMDYIEGQTLADYLHNTSYAGNIPAADEIVRLFTSLALAVDYAHLHRMIHRDIKPANILLDIRNTVHNVMGEPVLMDFGIVKMLGAAAITSTGISMGTPLYISPEQVHGQAGNEKSDIYALGVILYEMCTGTPPYRGDNPYVILAQRVSGPPEAPGKRNPQLSPEVDEVILRCLAMNPDERFPTASLLAAALAEAFNISIPDLIRHVLLSSRQTSTSLSLASSTVPITENPAVAMKVVTARNAEAALMGEATILSDRDSTVIEACEGTSTQMGGDTILSETGAMVVAPTDGKSPKRDDTLLSNTGVPTVSVTGSQTQSAAKSSITDDESSALPTSSDIQKISLSSFVTPPLPSLRRSPPVLPGGKGKRWFIPVCSLLMIVLLGMGVISTYIVLNKRPTTLLMSTVSSGNVTFVSSDQFDQQNIPFMNDGIQVHLYHVSDPAPGQHYYAWGEDDARGTHTIFLGTLQNRQGNATLSYIDRQHRNLLAYVSRVLVTEQPASSTQKFPSRDRVQWRYTAMIPQTPSSRNHLSYLDHLRRLLVSDPTLERFQLHHGIDFWLLNNTQEIDKEIMMPGVYSNPQEMRQILIYLLYILDGPCASQELSNTPGSNTLADGPIAQASRISLLDCRQGMRFPGYLAAATHNLNEMARAPGISPQEMQHTVQVKRNLSTIRACLEQMRGAVLQLIHMNNGQLKRNHMLYNELVIDTNDVMSGYFDPVTQTLQLSIGQICNEITFLAHFDVSLYSAM